jgi:M6 family metalloprotease-like protein
MRNKFTFLFAVMIIVLQFAVSVSKVTAVTAYPNPTQYKQPDGSTLTIQLQGDEFVHWATTVDGYTIMTNASGTYEYAKTDNDGYMVYSGIQANNPEVRSVIEINFLNTIKPGIFFSDKQFQEIKDKCPIKPKYGEKIGGFPTTGTRNLIMILANFSNTTTTYTQAQFNNYMNQANYNGTGSFKDFFFEASYGQLTVNTTVTTWVTVPNTHDYYGPQARWGEFAYAACVAANPIVNYALYDNDANGIVDGVAIIHQGRGQEESGSITDIWSHSWDLASAGYTVAQRTMDGVVLYAYTTQPERNATGMGTIGVMCHEFGHNLGSPDFYDTNGSTGGSYTGTGYWDLMASGSWNGVSGTKPAHPNPYIKCYIYSWATPTVLSAAQTVTMNNSTQNSTYFFRYNTTTANEYFLCENKQQTGFDVGVPYHGLLIYHVDGSYIASHTNSNDINTGSHQGLYPVCANAAGNPPTVYGSINSSGCPFPGSGARTTFTDATTPHSHSWAGANTNYPIHTIAENAGVITFCFINCCTLPAQPSAITGAATPCQGTPQNYSVTNVVGVTYNWTFPAGWTQTAGGTTNAITVTVGAGAGSITCTPSNACGAGTARTLAVTPTTVPAQPSTITGSATPCQGSSQNYSVTNVAGVTYTWTFPAGWTQTGGGTTNAITVTVGAGAGNITCTPSNACGNGTARTLAVTLTNVPAQPSTITGSATPCQTSSQNYSVTNVVGVTYTWTFPTGWTQTGGGTTNAITVTVGTGVGNITVTPSNTCGNGTARTLAVTPSLVPAQPSAITGAATPCQGTSQNYSVTNVAGVTYTWTCPAGWTQTGGGTTNAITVTVGAGTGNITCTPSNACGNGTAQTLAVSPTTIPAQPNTITGSAAPCQGSSQNYNVTNVAGVTYTWTFPAGWTQTAGGTTNAITVTVGAGTGNITCTPSNACGNGTARTLAVTPVTAPAQPSAITGSATPCQTTSQNYSVTNVAGVTYTWTFPAGWTQTGGGTTNAITVTVGATAGNITCTPSNACGNGTARTLAVTPSLIPAQPSAITGGTTPCQGSSQNYSVTNVAGVTYTWTFPAGWTQTGGGTTNAITVTVGAGAGNITCTPSNACGNGTAQTLAVTPSLVPAQPSAITGSTAPCQGSSQNYSVTNVAGVTYTWTLPAGWTQTGGGNTNAITVTVGASAGNISCTPSNACGNGIAQTLAVAPATAPSQPSTITGSATPCEGSSQNYSVTNVAGVTYTWTFPAGWTQTGGGTTNAITVTVGAGAGNITCTPSNACGNGTAQTLAVTPSTVPAQPSVITGNATPYYGTSENYSVTNVTGVTYTWTFPTGWVQTGGGNTNAVTVTVGSGSGNITCTPSNTCGNGTPRTLAVTVYGVGIKELGSGKSINIKPNPTEGIISINFKGYSGDIKIIINNAQGGLISSETISAQTESFVKTIDISKYPNGIYYMKFVNNGKTFVEKIVKQ